jgi:hypothetical protein
MRYVIAIFVVIFFAGCEQNPEKSPETFAPDESKYKLVLLVDMTQSFSKLMADNAKAYQFLLDVIDAYFRDRIGSPDQIIVAEISVVEPFVIWQGTPFELREEFDPQKFAALLRDHSDPDGSPVHLATAKTLEFLMADPNVAAGKTKPIFFVLSDMDDNFERTPELKERILRDLTAYGKLDGVFGIYYCDPDLVVPWKKALDDAGIKNNRVESGAHSKPDLPSFE